MHCPIVVWLAIAVSFHTAIYAQPRKHPLDGKGDAQIFKELEEAERKLEQERASRPAHPKLPKQDPCAVLTVADVRKVLKDAKPGKRDRRVLEEKGIAVCEWNTDRGRHVTLYLESTDRQSNRNARDTESLPPGHRKLSGIGDEAVAFVMRRDDKLGQPDMGLISARKGVLAFQIEFNDIVQMTDDKVIGVLRELALATMNRI